MTLALAPTLSRWRGRGRNVVRRRALPKRQKNYQLGWIFCDCVGGGPNGPDSTPTELNPIFNFYPG
jgi:hypothetical protein